MEIKDNYQRIAIDKIKVNQWNPNEQTEFIFKHSRNSLRTQGQLLPIIVREVGGAFEIIDGEHRFRAALAEGAESVSANNLGKVTDEVAKQLTIIMNETRGQARRDKLTALLQDLEDTMGIEKLLAAIPLHETEIHSLLGSNEVDWEQTNDLSAPVIIGDNASPLNPVAEATPNVPAPQDSNEAVIAVTVDKKTHRLFFEQIDRICKIAECPVPKAIGMMLQIVVDNDLKAFAGKGKKPILRKKKKR